MNQSAFIPSTNKATKFSSNFEIDLNQSNTKQATRNRNLNQTVVEVINPQIDMDEDNGLDDWAGQIGIQNKKRIQNQHRDQNETQVISFYDEATKNDGGDIFSDGFKNEMMVIQDIEDEDAKAAVPMNQDLETSVQ